MKRVLPFIPLCFDFFKRGYIPTVVFKLKLVFTLLFVILSKIKAPLGMTPFYLKTKGYIFSFIFLLLFFLIFQLFFPVKRAYSDENKCKNISSLNSNEIDNCLTELQSALDMSKRATAPFESQLINMRNQLVQIEQRVDFLEKDIIQKRKTINEGYKDLEKQKELLNKTVRDYYIKTYFFSPLVVFVSSDDASNITRILAYQKREANRDKEIITDIALKIADLETRKQALEDEESRLSVTKSKLDSEKAEIEKLVGGAKAYQATLTNQIAQLSAKQQELLAQKLGSLNLPKSAYSMRGGCTDDRNIDPGFSPRFAIFTYGVPNRVGLNQFGAWGRAKAGQDYEQILRAYYGFDALQDVDTNTNIRVNDSNGFNSGNIIWSGGLEDYIKRIYEVPDSWADNNLAVLKAQAIAARSYVLAATNNGASSICANEYCQAFQTNPKEGNWEQAVNSTSGKAMISGGQPIKAWYSSTHGGYVFTSGDIGWSQTAWTKRATDTNGGVGSFSDLQNNAYDKDSPVFYCDWGSRAQYNKTAWLKAEEIADIVNVLMLAKKDSSTQKHLSQVDKPNPDGVETWDAQRVRQELGSKAFNSISDISISADFGSGRTTTVTVSGDGKSESFGGDEFKTYFNLRAPANINIVGPLYNAEKR